MSVFVVRYTHPATPGWALHLEAHTKWLLARLEDRSLLASGPVEATHGHGALLVFDVDTRAALDALLAGDPYAQHDLVSSCEVIEWNPLFGAFQAHSSLPAMLQKGPLGVLLGGLAG